MKTLMLHRFFSDKRVTLGTLTGIDQAPLAKVITSSPMPRTYVDHICFTVERGWQYNEPFVSCIPDGDYELILVNTTKVRGYAKTWGVSSVEGRTSIQWHPANVPLELEGCIAPVTRIRRYLNFRYKGGIVQDTFGGVRSRDAWKKLMAWTGDDKGIKLSVRTVAQSMPIDNWRTHNGI